MQHPKLALRSVYDLIEYRGKTVYHVSRKFSRSVDYYAEQILTGDFGVRYYDDGDSYVWYTYKRNPNGPVQETSAMDAHLQEQNYNDWYLFPTRDAAMEYLGLCPKCGRKIEEESA